MKNAYKIRFYIACTVFTLSILGITGLFYPIKVFDVQFLPVLQRTIVDFSVIPAVILGLILLLTLIFGRLYCSTICPFGILQELVLLIKNKGKNKNRGNFFLKYFILALTIGAFAGGSAAIIRYIEPYTYFGKLSTLTVFGIIPIVILITTFLLKTRFFCTNLCPIGAFLGLISKISLKKIYIKKKDVYPAAFAKEIALPVA